MFTLNLSFVCFSLFVLLRTSTVALGVKNVSTRNHSRIMSYPQILSAVAGADIFKHVAVWKMLYTLANRVLLCVVFATLLGLVIARYLRKLSLISAKFGGNFIHEPRNTDLFLVWIRIQVQIQEELFFSFLKSVFSWTTALWVKKIWHMYHMIVSHCVFWCGSRSNADYICHYQNSKLREDCSALLED